MNTGSIHISKNQPDFTNIINSPEEFVQISQQVLQNLSKISNGVEDEDKKNVLSQVVQSVVSMTEYYNHYVMEQEELIALNEIELIKKEAILKEQEIRLRLMSKRINRGSDKSQLSNLLPFGVPNLLINNSNLAVKNNTSNEVVDRSELSTPAYTENEDNDTNSSDETLPPLDGQKENRK